MVHYVYIIQSLSDDVFYKGYTLDFIKRLEYHNLGNSSYTSKKTPWKLVFVTPFENKKDALIFEKKIKRYNRESILQLIRSELNVFGKNC